MFVLEVGIRFSIFLLFWVRLQMHWAGYRYLFSNSCSSANSALNNIIKRKFVRVYAIAYNMFYSNILYLLGYHPILSNLAFLLNPAYPKSQTHRNSHTITMHHQNRRTPLTKHLQITQIPRARLSTPTRPLKRTRQCRKHHRCVFTLPSHQLIQNQMLGSTWQVVER